MTEQRPFPGFDVSIQAYASRHTLIFRGRRIADRRPVILKTAKSEHASKHDNQRLRREFELGSSIDHPRVIAYLDLIKVNGCYVIVEEDIDGVGLSERLPEEGFSTAAFMPLAKQLIEGLQGVHDAGVIHRDIKLRNIVVHAQTGLLKIIDFGVSTKIQRETQQEQVHPRKLEGTPAYMSPEQTGRMNRAMDYRTDFYSLGVSFYEMLTGRLPFQSKDPLEYIHQHIAKAPKSPHLIRPHIPTALSEIVLKLMAKNAEDRYQSTSGLLHDLEKCERLADPTIPFELGRSDVPDTFVMPQKLYGREREIARLREVAARSGQGRNELVIVSGVSGMGKSKLIGEIQKQVVTQAGFMISGQFEEVDQNEAYMAITAAFRTLIRHLLGEPASKLQFWRNQLRETLGENAQIIVALAPELALIIGPQKPPPSLPPTETRLRFLNAFGQFVSIFARQEHPLLLHLDDVQWADVASLRLLDALLKEGDALSVFLTWRLEENAQELEHFIRDRRQTGALVHHLEVEAWELEDLKTMLSDSLHRPRHAVKHLAAALWSKCEGNPLFTETFLTSAHRDGALRFNPLAGRWEWSVEHIRRMQTGDDVAKYLARRLETLDLETQRVLGYAACIGRYFDVHVLAWLADVKSDRVVHLLEAAVTAGVVTPHHEVQQPDFVSTDAGRNPLSLDAVSTDAVSTDAVRTDPVITDSAINVKLFPRDPRNYRFQHDRLRDAAYELISAHQRPDVHHRIGRRLINHMTARERRQNLTEVVRHLNAGQELITEPRERNILSHLNLRLARRAKSAAAYEAAIIHLEEALALLPDDSWHAQYRLTFSIFMDYAECTFLRGDIEQAEQFTLELMEQARTSEEKARLLHMRMGQYAIHGMLDHVLDMGLEALELLDAPLPAEPSPRFVEREARKARVLLRQTDLAALAHCKPARNRKDKLIQRVLMAMTTPAHFTGATGLYHLITYRRLHLLCRPNPVPEALSALVTYAGLRNVKDGAYAENAVLADQALDLGELLPTEEIKCRIYALHAALIAAWREEPKTISDAFIRVTSLGRANGDMFFAAYACAYVYQWRHDLDLRTCVRRQRTHLDEMRTYKYEHVILLGDVLQQFRQALRGKTRERTSLSDEHFDENDCFETLSHRNYRTELAIFELTKLQLAFFFDETAEAQKHHDALADICFFLRGTLHNVDYRLFSLLLTADRLQGAVGLERRKLWRLIREHEDAFQRWTDYQEKKFTGLQALARAERARLEDRTLLAMDAYDEAVQAFGGVDHHRYQALANERAGAFYLSLGRHKTAAVYYLEARELYRLWGAKAKVDFLNDRILPKFSGITALRAGLRSQDFDEELDPALTIRSLTTRVDGVDSTHAHDISTIVKITQTIAGEMNLERLLVKVLGQILENAGAQRGFLVLSEEGGLFVRASADIDGAEARYDALEGDAELSRTIVRTVFRTNEDVVLQDAVQDEQFAGDPYLSAHEVKSLLCLPIRRKGQTLGVLYLENNHAPHAFGKGRLRMIHLLLSHAAISLENARLYADSYDLNQAMLREIEERKQAEARVRSLNEELEARVEDRTQQLEAAQKELVEKAHQAGMADIATSVLHNVGNILNSVITSSQLIEATARESRLASLPKAGAILSDHRHHIADFFSNDPKGPPLLDYFIQIGDFYSSERETLMTNTRRLMEKITDIRQVIMHQQNHASRGFQNEAISIDALVEDALHIMAKAIDRDRIVVEREYQNAPQLVVQKTKLLNIIMNLLKNAVEALQQSHNPERLIQIQIEQTHGDDQEVLLVIRDTGIGIPRENISKIFTHGFTTKTDNQGFGLHGCANHMAEMGGSISVDSDGIGHGAAFRLHFPLATPLRDEAVIPESG